ncbi:aspartyl protease family protein [Sphingomonas crusticola]|uniref:aspartyl protease family protein n=1 Tax=Sphingomonas crusticola TaxID=1697973 RepID=UPI000E2522FF|nr:aspartyl protease family protein [Sphingomonas crusticola]
MLVPRLGLPLLLAILVSTGDAQAPRIGKPRPAPSAVSNLPPLPPAVLDDTLAIGGDDLKARRIETRLSVEVRVNDRGPYQFIVDSGADTSVIGLRIARDLELPLGTPAILNGMTDRNIVDRVKVDSLTLGPSTIRDLQLPALREDDLGGQGMIGIDALVRRRLMMDFEKRLIKVEDATTPVISFPGEIVVVARRKRGQLILTHIRARGIALDAVIDTGSQVTIGNLKLRDRLVRRRQAFQTVEAIGVTGKAIDLQMAVIPELQIGAIVIRNLPVAFADLPPFQMFGIADEPALLLGTDVLNTFRKVSLDFEARKVRFQLRRCAPQGIVVQSWSMSMGTRLSSLGDQACSR